MSRRRLDEIRRQLPESLDLLAVSVGAGLGLQGALANVAEHSQGALATEWRRVLSDIRLGSSLVEALTGLAARADIAEESGARVSWSSASAPANIGPLGFDGRAAAGQIGQDRAIGTVVPGAAVRQMAQGVGHGLHLGNPGVEFVHVLFGDGLHLATRALV